MYNVSEIFHLLPFLKNYSIVSGIIITSIVNLCLVEVSLLASFAHVMVYPLLYKPTLYDSLLNISTKIQTIAPSLLSRYYFISKSLGRVVDNLNCHLSSHNLLLPFHFTETTLVAIHYHNISSIDRGKGNSYCFPFLYLSAALIPFIVVYPFFVALNTDSVYLVLFSVYSHLTCTIVPSRYKSPPIILDCGVPHVLGLLLFTLYEIPLNCVHYLLVALWITMCTLSIPIPN